MRRAGIGVLALTLLAVAAMVAGCSSGSGLSAQSPGQSSTSSSSAQASSPASTSPASTLPTGPELAKLLPPHSALPPGWTAPSNASAYTRHLTALYSKPLADLGSGTVKQYNSCEEVTLAANGSNLMALWEMSWAYTAARPPHFPALSTPAVVDIADFLPGGAARQLAWVRALARQCHHYRDPNDHSRVTVTATSVPGLGDQALYVQVVNPYNFGGQMIRARSGTLLVRTGYDMIAASQGGTTSDPTDVTVPFSRLKQLAEQYLGSVTHLRGNSS